MTFENRYSWLDRMLHRISFSTNGLQLVLSDIEDSMFAKQLSDIEINKPVFVTAIPRAGTTLLLELLVNQGEFVTHTYRNMPFVLVPLLWAKFSDKFRNYGLAQERAHGDGMQITVDSPEAFEEIVWKAFWKDHYSTESIIPWGSEDSPEFTTFIYSHIRKIIQLHRQAGRPYSRYVSKNNLNIARIPYLMKLFPDARIVIPFRDPVKHAASLLLQHKNFLKIHKEDTFAKKYMEAIGHYDFGENLRPVDFNHWLGRASDMKPDTLEFWLRYWLASYQILLSESASQVVFFNFDLFCHQPDLSLAILAECAQLHEPDKLVQQASKIRSARSHDVNLDGIGKPLLDEINDIYQVLLKESVA